MLVIADDDRYLCQSCLEEEEQSSDDEETPADHMAIEVNHQTPTETEPSHEPGDNAISVHSRQAA